MQIALECNQERGDQRNTSLNISVIGSWRHCSKASKWDESFSIALSTTRPVSFHTSSPPPSLLFCQAPLAYLKHLFKTVALKELRSGN